MLTKRSGRLVDLAPSLSWPPNVWIGVSVENQRWVSRIDDLRKVPASIRFLSCEPLLGALDLDLQGIEWVIAGGESGHHARPMKLQWATDLRDQCLRDGVPFFFKQWGAHDKEGRRGRKKQTGRLLDGEMWNQMPNRTRVTA